MGNTNGQTRGFDVARDDARSGEDPFAELADIFENELQFDPRFADGSPRSAAPQTARRPGPSAGRGADDVAAMEHELARAFEAETRAARATPAAVPAYRADYRSQAKTTPVAAAPVRKPSAGSRPTHLTDEEIDHELESVLRNLSTPAKPRGRIVVETQSFAPARIAEEAPPPAAHAEIDEFEELIRSELAAIRPAPARVVERDFEPAAGPEEYGEGEFTIEDRYVPPRRSMARRALTMGVSAVALLLIGGVGVAVWQNGPATTGGGSSEPLLIKADAQPYKTPPKDPGGRAYPNQNKAVYDRVAGANTGTPVQQALLQNSEEPIELPADDDGSNYADGLPGVELGGADEAASKDETRVSAATEAEASPEETVLQPRKVRTMTVGADGRLVMAEAQPASTPAPTQAAEPMIAAVAPLAVNTAKPVEVDAPAVAPAQPDPIEVAAVAPPAPPIASAMPTSGFFVQVSSQPSEAAAQQSMHSFGAKYGSVVSGKPVGIQSAEIAGKGTYYRVRVAAETREEANGICSKLKSAGATCFVTR